MDGPRHRLLRPSHVPTWLILGLLATVALTGCIDSEDPAKGAPGTDVDQGWSLRALAFGEGHDHTDAAQHEGLTTPNFEVLGFVPWSSDYYGGQSGGGYLCGDAQETRDGRRIAAIESRSDVAFAIADVTDPGAPSILGEFVMEHTYIYDTTVVPDGKHVVLVSAGTDNLPPNPTAWTLPGVANSPSTSEDRTPTLTWTDACSGKTTVLADANDPLPYPMNIILVDISNPSNPTITDNQPLFGFGHSALPYAYDDRDVLLITTATGVTPTASGYFFYEVVETPAGAKLRLLSTYKPPGEGPLAAVTGPRGHDGWIAPHPGTGQVLAYLGGGGGLTVLDVTDPEAPVEVGRWYEPDAGTLVHGAFPLPELWNDRHYTVIGPEYCNRPEHTPTGIVWVLDTTVPADPFIVAGWTLPHDVEWDGGGCYTWSNHYFTVVGETLFMSLYHGGIWAADLSPIKDAARSPDALPDAAPPFYNLESTGVFLPANASLPGSVEPVRWAPTIEEVVAMPDGSLVTFDGNYGLYTMRFDPSRPAPAPEPWPLERP